MFKIGSCHDSNISKTVCTVLEASFWCKLQSYFAIHTLKFIAIYLEAVTKSNLFL
jgi:hypothetical protein